MKKEHAKYSDRLEQSPAKPPPKGKDYLLTIGINAYQHFRPLQNAVKDVEDFDPESKFGGMGN